MVVEDLLSMIRRRGRHQRCKSDGRHLIDRAAYAFFRDRASDTTTAIDLPVHDRAARRTGQRLARPQIDQIDPLTYGQFNNDVRPRWFDATRRRLLRPAKRGSPSPRIN
jgi:hypothetical protein